MTTVFWLQGRSAVWIGRIVLLMVLLLGLRGLMDIGVSWDEPHQMNVGEAAFRYVFEGQEWPEAKTLRVYGTTFELPASMAIAFLGLDTLQSMFFLKHFLTFGVYVLGLLTFLWLCRSVFRNDWLALAGLLLLVLQPRLFGDGFYNSKDIPNLTAYATLLCVGLYWQRSRSGPATVLMGVISGLATGLRPSNIILIGILGIGWLVQTFDRRTPSECRTDLLRFAECVLLWVAVTYITWPYLWADPIHRFLESMAFMTSLPVDTFYMGIKINALPWHYLPVWIGITTPLFTVALLCIGCLGYIGVLTVQRKDVALFRTYHTTVLLSLVAPVAAIYVSGAGIFDGWRHVYFLAVPMTLIAVEGLQMIIRFAHRWYTLRSIGLVTAAVLLLFGTQTAWWMYRHHPLQSLYFSVPAPWVQHRFELDYWGLSFRTALERVLALEPAGRIPVWVSSSAGYSTLAVLPFNEISRLHLTSPDKAWYGLNNFRSFNYVQTYPYPEVDAIRVGGVRVLSIQKLPAYGKPVEEL